MRGVEVTETIVFRYEGKSGTGFLSRYTRQKV